MVTFVLGQALLPLDAVKLGRFIVNVDEPQADYFDPNCGSATVSVSKQLNYRASLQDAADRHLSLDLTRLVSSARSKRHKCTSQVTTDRVETYKLQKHKDWFEEAIKLPETRKWIERAISQCDDVYLIVGYYTFTNAKIHEGAAKLSATALSVEIPVSNALTASGIVIPFNIADPGVGSQLQHRETAHADFMATGEQICAIQYRKVNFKWYSSKDLDRATLDKNNQWRTFLGVRGQDDVATDDVLQVDIEGDQEPEEGDWERVTSEDGETFLI